jgi:hypothetical protein
MVAALLAVQVTYKLTTPIVVSVAENGPQKLRYEAK